jgi:hypothetical protein
MEFGGAKEASAPRSISNRARRILFEQIAIVSKDGDDAGNLNGKALRREKELVRRCIGMSEDPRSPS